MKENIIYIIRTCASSGVQILEKRSEHFACTIIRGKRFPLAIQNVIDGVFVM